MRNFALALLVLILLCLQAKGQIRIVDNPAVAQQSHPELKVDQILFYTDSVVVRLSILNQLTEGGWFCADRNTFIEDPDSFTRLKVIGKTGIPWCPNAHRFSKVGEELTFSLVFPAIAGNPETLNIVEVCDKSCFELKGIILSEKLNRDIRLFDEAMRNYSENSYAKALELFAQIVEEIPERPTHVYGYSFYNLARICWQIGERDYAQEWVKQLELSSLPNKQYFLRNLEKELVD
ncbi:MAG TPA: hypothetical protein ENN24_03295 [Bacteroidetes bacterium]|nr:hypothetical protein [Bacteroidota bacterium]